MVRNMFYSVSLAFILWKRTQRRVLFNERNGIDQMHNKSCVMEVDRPIVTAKVIKNK